MAITIQQPTDYLSSTKIYYGLSADTKPTMAAHAGLPAPVIGSTFYEYDTKVWYVTYDGDHWAETPDNIMPQLLAAIVSIKDDNIPKILEVLTDIFKAVSKNK
jgi:hypothetical protein